MARFTITSVNEFLRVNNRHGEYLIIDTVEDNVVVDGLPYEQANMEARMLNGEDVDFEEYEEIMNSF